MKQIKLDKTKRYSLEGASEEQLKNLAKHLIDDQGWPSHAIDLLLDAKRIIYERGGWVRGKSTEVDTNITSAFYESAENKLTELRDHFAGLAMQAEISRWGDERGSIDYENTARRAYKMAGAMLKERKEDSNV